MIEKTDTVKVAIHSLAASDGEEQFYLDGAAQAMVAHYAGVTVVAMVPQREMGYHQELKKYVVLDQVKESEVATISSRGLRRRMVSGEDVSTWFSYPEVSDLLKCSFPPRSKQGR